MTMTMIIIIIASITAIIISSINIIIGISISSRGA